MSTNVPHSAPCSKLGQMKDSHAYAAQPEVLAPAGNLATLRTAIDFGADAVYAGGQQFGMRSAPKNLTLDDFEAGVAYAHERGARVYATCNILPDSDEVTAMNAYMGRLAEIGVDALIVADIGVLMAARRIAPHTEIHVSTQAGVTNYQAATALAELGASRVVLARELTLPQIRELRAHVPASLEIEAFVHGSMCMAFSGRCSLSKHATGRDANHGDCVQPCRWQYHVVEEKRPGEFLPVEVDERGAFIFSSQDMNMLEHVDDVLDAGVTSLKIEGRAKGAYYVAAMANAYKAAVTAYQRQRANERAAGAPAAPIRWPEWLAAEPYKVTHREYSTGFYYPDQPAGEIGGGRGGYINDWRWLGTVLGYDPGTQRLRVYSRNKIAPGMDLEFVTPGAWQELRAPVQYLVPSDNRGASAATPAAPHLAPCGNSGAAQFWDAAGEAAAEINNPAHEFEMWLPVSLAGARGERIPEGSMIRARA